MWKVIELFIKKFNNGLGGTRRACGGRCRPGILYWQMETLSLSCIVGSNPAFVKNVFILSIILQ